MHSKVIQGVIIWTLASLSGAAFAHGLIQEPPSRNWFCGAVTKPHEILSDSAQYPACGDAFSAEGMGPNDGYSFMSVLTHTQGRRIDGERPNVCSYGSETWNGRATVWDQPIDWPTTRIKAGENSFTWNIEWGKHFDDTEEFVYYITKPDFKYELGKPLKFSDFESEPFCHLSYNDARPEANPRVTSDRQAFTFKTVCTVPEREGRHVIYAEWGRNKFTYERFHGCVDVVFDPNAQPPADPIRAQIELSPPVTEFVGAGTLVLDARSSVGSDLKYQWSVEAPNPDLYKLTKAQEAVASLSLSAPQVDSTVTITLVVSRGDQSSGVIKTFVHQPAQADSRWVDWGPLMRSPRDLKTGDQVSIRTVDSDGA